MTQSSDVQGNINKIIIVKVKFILTFTIILSNLLKPRSKIIPNYNIPVISNSTAYTPEHSKYHPQVLPQAMQKNWQKGRLRERRAREGNRSRGGNASFCWILSFPLLKRCLSRIFVSVMSCFINKDKKFSWSFME